MRAPLRSGLRGARYTGLEASPYLCERYGWEQGSLATWTKPPPFDLVICYDVLQYLDARDASAAIRGLGRLCSGVLHRRADARRLARVLRSTADRPRGSPAFGRLVPVTSPAGLRECRLRHVRPAERSPASLGAGAAAPAADPPGSEDEVRPRHRPARLILGRPGASRGTVQSASSCSSGLPSCTVPAMVTRRITDAHAHSVQFDPCVGDDEYLQAVDRRRLDLPANVTASERMAPLVIPASGPGCRAARTSTQLPGRAAAVCHRPPGGRARTANTGWRLSPVWAGARGAVH